MNLETALRRFCSFAGAQSGATAIEYALIASGIAGAIIATVTLLGGSVVGMYTAVATAFK